MRSTRIVSAVAVGATLVAGLTACSGGGSGSGGGSDDGLSPAQAAMAALKKASKSTDRQESAKVTAHQVQGTPQGTMTTDSKGALDWSGQGMTGEMTSNVSGAGSAISSGRPVETRFTQDAIYLKSGAKWLKTDFDALGGQGNASGAYIKDQMQNNNPSRSVDLLMASGKVKKVGSESVKGQQADHYRGTVKVSQLTRMQSKNLSEKQLDQLTEQMEQMGYKTETIDLWIGDDDLLVKKRERSEGKNGKLEATAFYSDYGTKVSVQEPPASDVMDMQDALKGAQG